MPAFDLERAAMETSRCIIITDHTQLDDPISFVNPAFTAHTGYSRDEAVGRNSRFLQGTDTDPTVVAEIRAALNAGQSIQREILNYRKNGQPFWNDIAIDPVHDERGAVVGFVSIQFDVSLKNLADCARLEAERRLHLIDDNMPGYLYQRLLKPDGTIELPYLSMSLNHILGLPDGTVITAGYFYEHVHSEDRDGLMRAIRSSAAGLSMFQEEFRLVRSSGDLSWFRSDAFPRATPNGDIVWEGVAIDVTAEKAGQIKLAFIESHDSLTGLCNRQVFNDAVKTAVNAVASGSFTGVFYVDLDDFEVLNQLYGQPFGDRVLRRVGLRLTEFAETWGGVAARLGGDEFAVLFAALPLDISELELAEAMHKALTRPMNIDGQEVILEVCIGAASNHDPDSRFPEGADDRVAELTTRANLALSAAKQDGPNVCRTYSSHVDDRMRNRVQLRQSLQHAIQEQQFALHYQPLVDLLSGRIIGAEALVRWYHPDLGLQRPELFIPLAEATGLIVPLGAWVLKEAMRQARLWAEQGIEVPRIAVNVSSIQLQKPGFTAMAEQALAETRVKASGFKLELTESILIETSVDIRQQLSELRSLGFGIAIDDFGTGHSNFKYLKAFPIDEVKIDQDFVRHLVVDSRDATIIHAIIKLAQGLELGVIAEGIETAMQRDFLIAEGCSMGQGALFSMPLPAEDFGRLLMKSGGLWATA
jgi:diguanylate cyclase (GGDEF)-like protein/PAS domain S-box-containing protein